MKNVNVMRFAKKSKTMTKSRTENTMWSTKDQCRARDYSQKFMRFGVGNDTTFVRLEMTNLTFRSRLFIFTWLLVITWGKVISNTIKCLCVGLCINMLRVCINSLNSPLYTQVGNPTSVCMWMWIFFSICQLTVQLSSHYPFARKTLWFHWIENHRANVHHGGLPLESPPDEWFFK